MIQMIELVNKGIKTVTITVFYILKEPEEN